MMEHEHRHAHRAGRSRNAPRHIRQKRRRCVFASFVSEAKSLVVSVQCRGMEWVDGGRQITNMHMCLERAKILCVRYLVLCNERYVFMSKAGFPGFQDVESI